VCAVMKRYGQVDLIEELNGDQIHRLENVLTLTISLHYFFDKLDIWLEATVSDVAFE
jgi:hypothetical protein